MCQLGAQVEYKKRPSYYFALEILESGDLKTLNWSIVFFGFFPLLLKNVRMQSSLILLHKSTNMWRWSYMNVQAIKINKQAISSN